MTSARPDFSTKFYSNRTVYSQPILKFILIRNSIAMKEYMHRPERQSRTLDRHPRASKPTQADISASILPESKSLSNSGYNKTAQFQVLSKPTSTKECVQLLTQRNVFPPLLNTAIQNYNTAPTITLLLDLLEQNNQIINNLRFFQIYKRFRHNQLKNEIIAELHNSTIMNGAVRTDPAALNYNIARYEGLEQKQNTQSYNDFQKTLYSDLADLAIRSQTFRNLLRFAHAKQIGPNPHNITVLPDNTVGGAGMLTDRLDPNANIANGLAGGGADTKIIIDTLTDDFGGNPRQIVLAHELIHALHAIYGVRVLDNTIFSPGQSFRQLINNRQDILEGASPDDVAVMGNINNLPVQNTMNNIYRNAGINPLNNANMGDITENMIRAELGLPLRQHY